ncbi:MAG: hypothetical protein ICCCNLDF_00287 [Planctomycetes bacterium]|nr:hypothetical protein [Planctomycetota bacterium]
MSKSKKHLIVVVSKKHEALLRFMEEAEREANGWPAWRKKNFGSTVQNEEKNVSVVVVHKRKKKSKQIPRKRQLSLQ